MGGLYRGTRSRQLHVPPSYDPEQPMPVVFCIHGLGRNALMFCANGADMLAKSDAEGFILVMPNGHQNSWNGGICCGAAASALDEVALMRATFEEVSEHAQSDHQLLRALSASPLRSCAAR